MKALVLHSAFLALLGLILSPLAVAHASSPPADGVHFCQVLDWERDHPHPAAKRLADLNVGESRTVRLIYFLPKDRQSHPDIDATLDILIKDAQQFFAEAMENHGFGRKTFAFETDQNGKAVVHHVNGRFNSADYLADISRCVDAINEQFDTSKNIYLIALDLGFEGILSGGIGGFHNEGAGGLAITFALALPTIVHELGHAFGLQHDSRHIDNKKLIRNSYTNDVSTDMLRSFCAAELLNVSRYFNAGQIASKGPTIMHMLPPVASPPDAIRFRFEVTDPDGLHQAQLIKSQGAGLMACTQLEGESNTVEFITTASRIITNTQVGLQVTDVHGNFASNWFPIDITHLFPPSEVVVSIPDPDLAALLRKTLNLAPSDAIKQLDMQKLEILEIFAPAISIRDRILIADLTGLEYATNLVILDLPWSRISDLTPLAGTNLHGLQLRSSQISDVSPLAELTNLWRLDLSFNRISDITPLAGLTRLTELSLVGNKISDVSPLAGLVNLEQLWLWENPIADMSPLRKLLRQNPNLEIYIDIGDVPPSMLTALEKISGDEQQGSVGTALAEPFVVSALDQDGSAIAGAVVTFSVTAGGGTLSATTVTTDANGRARSTLTLGSEPGTNTVTATVEGIEPETFTAIGQATTDSNGDGEMADGEEDSEMAFGFAEEVEDQAYTAGTAISALVLPEATGGEGEVTYRVSGLPAGLAFDAATRTISGTPEAATDGAVEVTYTAQDSAGATATLTFSITVNPPLSFGDLFDLFGAGGG